MEQKRSISLQAARYLHLAAQGLLRTPAKARYDDLMRVIRQMALLQIDTIHVVARSPYLVLFSRLGDYPPAWLEQALASGVLFEYWAHEACFVPREDYPLLRHRMLEPERLGWKYNAQWVAAHQAEIAELLAHIAQRGPVKAADFTSEKNSPSGWWAWKPHKRHLENLFSAGELMVVGRHNFQRVYDLRSRVMPDWQDALHSLSEAEAVNEMLMKSARSLGIFREGWLPDYYRLKRAPLKSFIATAQASGAIVPVEVETLGELWLHAGLLPLLEKPLSATHSALLSPFDPVVWDRKRARELFSFDYRIECYTPEAKRKYGYFVLPILHRGELKGRLDAKMARKAGQLVIKNIWLEETTRVTKPFLDDIQHAISRFARWQGANNVIIEQAPDALLARWQRQWSLTE
ncbi:winged helix-turn-helix domain-containing protein [Pantoea sp.]|uniref:winged helix-turn-helix domain-containing protein n=1 Tax=Pantoea sp. TaxID=69393 RepID=UPI0028A14869|nr:winged helix-turn-helix domain-containing protein [Pantoea sp.]